MGNPEVILMSEPIVFFGSGPVAAKALELLAKNFEVEAVITKPQPEHHKQVFPVLATCAQLGLVNVLTVSNKKELSELFSNQSFKSRLGIVIDFGIIITQDVIDAFELGIVNSHFSLLPEWRGADPITFSILSGQKQTGVSLMLINDKLDEGEILAMGVYDIKDDETTPSLTDYLILLSDSLLRDTLPRYFIGELRSRPQEKVAKMMHLSPKPSYSKKLTKEDGQIDWQKPAAQIEREIRAYAGWPKSRVELGGRDLVITAAHVEPGGGQPGIIWLEGKQIGVQTSDGILVIDRLVPAGKKEMTGSDFLLGYSPTN
jgi:methionyl-tRNA formyltransferase